MSIFIKAQIFTALTVSTETIIDWATSMLVMGYDSPNLRILAGLTKLNCRSEVTYYVDQILQEFDCPKFEGKAAVLAYTSVVLTKFLKKRISQDQAIGEIYQLCLSWNYLAEIYDFYLLRWALNAFKYEDIQQYYWPNATPDNISIIIKNEAEKWLEKYPVNKI